MGDVVEFKARAKKPHPNAVYVYRCPFCAHILSQIAFKTIKLNQCPECEQVDLKDYIRVYI